MTSLVKKSLYNKLLVLLLLIVFLITFGFATGFIKEDSKVDENERIPLSGIEEEVSKWTCTCGYVYDPEVEGINFEDLPDDWVCPVCGMPKSSFNADITLDEIDSNLEHLQHILAMRMKHIAVLLRVQEAKDISQHSKEAIGYAIIQSSKSIRKAQEAIADYIASLESSTEDTTNENNITSSIEEKKQDKGEKSNNGNGNKPDKGEKFNNGKGKGKNK